MDKATTLAGAVLDTYVPAIEQHLSKAKRALSTSRSLLEQAKTRLAADEVALQSVSDIITVASPSLNTALVEAKASLDARNKAVHELESMGGLDNLERILSIQRRSVTSAEAEVNNLEMELATTQHAIEKRPKMQDAVNRATKQVVIAQGTVTKEEENVAKLYRQVEAYRGLVAITKAGMDGFRKLITRCHPRPAVRDRRVDAEAG